MPVISFFPSGGLNLPSIGQCIGSYLNSTNDLTMPTLSIRSSYLTSTPPYVILDYPSSGTTYYRFTILKKAQLRLKQYSGLSSPTVEATYTVILEPGHLYQIMITQIYLPSNSTSGRTRTGFVVTDYPTGVLTDGTVIFQQNYISGADSTTGYNPLFKLELI